MGARDENVFMARLAEQAERYDDMIEYTKRVAMMGSELTVEERNLLSVAYKNSVGARRSAWRVVSRLEQGDSERTEQGQITEIIRGYRAKVESELQERCSDAISLIERTILPNCVAAESKIFFLKMQGDYYRYLAEFTTGDVRSQAAQDALKAYGAATDSAASADGLPEVHPIRLGLALNFSVFYFEVIQDRKKACDLAKSAFEGACVAMGDAEDPANLEKYQDSTSIMSLLRDNLTIWTSDVDGGQDGTEVEDM